MSYCNVHGAVSEVKRKEGDSNKISFIASYTCATNPDPNVKQEGSRFTLKGPAGPIDEVQLRCGEAKSKDYEIDYDGESNSIKFSIETDNHGEIFNRSFDL